MVWPAYQSLHEVARASGGDVSLVRLEHERGWSLDIEQVAAAVRPNTTAIVVNLPYNPTGAHPPPETLAALLHPAESTGARLVCDEVYRLLGYDPAQPWAQAADVDERAVSINVMTKAYGLGGLRIGCVATRDRRLHAQVAKRKDYTTICNSAPAEVVAVIALRSRDRLLARVRGLIERNRAAVTAFFDEHSQLCFVAARTRLQIPRRPMWASPPQQFGPTSASHPRGAPRPQYGPPPEKGAHLLAWVPGHPHSS